MSVAVLRRPKEQNGVAECSRTVGLKMKRRDGVPVTAVEAAWSVLFTPALPGAEIEQSPVGVRITTRWLRHPLQMHQPVERAKEGTEELTGVLECC